MSVKKLCSILMFIFFTQFVNAFVLSIAKTDETCTANGTLTITVSNTTAGATMVYTIYHLPDVTTPISVQSTLTLGGLVSGSYRVVATESGGSSPTTQQQDVVIEDFTETLIYQLTVQNVRCGNDGRVTVTVFDGNGPFHYEIFQGPMTFPSQTSNVFTGLIPGQYSIRVFDVCGEGIVRVFTVGTDNTSLQIDHGYALLDCNNIRTTNIIQPQVQGGVIMFPLTVQYTVNPPTGPPIIFPAQTLNFNGSNTFAIQAHETIPYYYGQTSSYTITVTDACNQVYHLTPEMNIQMSVNVTPVSNGCTIGDMRIVPVNCIPPFTVSFLQSPPGFNPVLGNSGHPGPFSGSSVFYSTNNLDGWYTVKITDACGRTAQKSNYLYNTQAGLPYASTTLGCEEGQGGIIFSAQSPNAVLDVTILDAPPAYGFPLPHHVTEGSFFLDNYYLGSIPAGQYSISVTTACGGTLILNPTVEGYHEITNQVDVIEHCGSFDIGLYNTSSLDNNANLLISFWLQKYNPITHQWGHPDTGSPYTVGMPDGSNSINLNNNTINYNFGYLGRFRVIKFFRPSSIIASNSTTVCVNTLKEFVFDGVPKINKIYAFSCENGTYDVIVDATGAVPLKYRIVEKDGQPFLIENGNSYIFLGIAAGHYKFQVEDPCGNILNSEFDVPSPFNFGITGHNLCDGFSGSLVVPNFPILQYTWWRENDTATVLSTTNTLSFPNFFTGANAGIYHVRIQYTGNPNSCLDFVLDYTITGDNAPHAGLDNAVSFCRSVSLIDLNAFLTGNFDTSGTWTELNNNGTITNNVWNAAGLPVGTYHFMYEVASCDMVDNAQIDIEIKNGPGNITASVDPLVCEGNNINLTASSSANATYSWTGPNAFSSAEQNPIITNASQVNSGTYTVLAAIDDCVSESIPVTVVINAVPEFTLDAKCEGGRYKITVIPVNNSFDVTAVSYTWTGPNNYTNTTNPIDITQLATGNYSVTVTDTNGCDVSDSRNIDQTICFIPNVITPNDDDANQSFDLTGFNVTKIEIYNRWGRKVYERNNYLKEWHGQNMNGGILPDSTYYYIIKLSSEETKTGWIFLNRG